MRNYKNHEWDIRGVLKQKNAVPIKYEYTYNEKYDKYGIKNDQLSFLRLGYILGVLEKKPQNILDIGYGNGAFLKACNKTIQKTYGYDISPYPVPKNTERINTIFDLEFECVTLFDCLEHWENIYELKKIKSKYIIISVPELHNFTEKEFLGWRHYRQNEHIWYFTKYGLANFMKKIGYKLINSSNIEDTIRKPINYKTNILTCCFKREI
jgi:hypothetical protein